MKSQRAATDSKVSSTAEEKTQLREWVQREKAKRDQQEQQKEMQRRQECEGKPIFYKLIPLNILGEDHSITGFSYRYKLSTFRCPACSHNSWAAFFSYPHLDPSQILCQKELGPFDAKSFNIWGNDNTPESPEMVARLAKLKSAWDVPVAPGTSFGLKSIKVSRKPKYDFEFIMMTGCFFARRKAVQELLASGFDFDFVDVPAKGKYAEEADFVQMVIPVLAHEALAENESLCAACNRVTRTGKAIEGPDFLFDTPSIHRLPFFMTVEWGTLILSSSFVTAANKLGLNGLIEGKTLAAWPAYPDPVASRPPVRWVRAARPHEAAVVTTSAHALASPGETGSCFLADKAFCQAWLNRLGAFLKEVETQGGTGAMELGDQRRLVVPLSTPRILRVLLDACGGKLAFRHSTSVAGNDLTNNFALDVNTFSMLKRTCKRWAKETWIAEDPDEIETWHKAFPFACFQNGDYLALDGRSKSENPPVIRLRHDDASEELSSSLGDFLQKWESLRYASIEEWDLG